MEIQKELGKEIIVKNLDFWYNGKQILYDVNAEIGQKKITALIGPSGCGKSTFLRCMNRMNDIISIAKAEGEIHYCQQNILCQQTDVVELRKKIGMVFQKPNPFPMSIFDNVAYGLRLQGVKDKKQLGIIVEESLKKAELWEEVKDRLNVSAFRLSGSQQQRLCIARALAINPDVILLDEPCSALDPIATAKIESLLVKLKRDMTIMIVTHNMQQARRISDDAIYLLNGKIVEAGKTNQLFSKPKNKLTEDYISGVFG
ncbi:phosphate ABC transporter ATP-binding protein [Candidatus Woesearchaeota archaeon]|nr:phosphate ABC transporter ATP-binding protein [Candidatus Woesearchaeota archaeon]